MSQLLQTSTQFTKSSNSAPSLQSETVAVDGFPGISKLSNPETVCVGGDIISKLSNPKGGGVSLTKPTQIRSKQSIKQSGIIIAFIVIGIWASSLFFLLSLNISKTPTLWILPAMVWQTFFYTGLFITAHDAMHGVVFPQNHKINNMVGSVTLFLYGLFPYQKLLKKHWLHHHHPASDRDPDFHDSQHKNFFAWYFHFMKGYWSWTRIIALISVFNVVSYTIHIPEINLTLFWVIPSILSSVQLFYFGTFLPHQEPEGGYSNIHCARSNPLPVFLSFITCYHFGYHEEHHEYPHVPWWNLPTIYKMQKSIS